jgi:hypothetical protein
MLASATCTVPALAKATGSLDAWAAQIACAVVSSGALATAKYEPTMNTTGWDRFDLAVNRSSDAAAAAAAGYLEGWMTAQRISDHLHNILAHAKLLLPSGEAGGDEWEALVHFEVQQEAWVVGMLTARPQDEAALWDDVARQYTQVAGIAAGLQARGAELYGMSPWRAAMTVNMMADYPDVLSHLFPTRRVDWSRLSLAQAARARAAHDHCSAFVALAASNSELLVAHNMWWSFSEGLMPVFKTVSWGGWRSQMSSFPGALASMDDFYTLPSPSQRLAVMETTNPLYNTSLLDQVTPRSLWYWSRVLAANRVATDGAGWVDLFSKHNSGTYNSMWMVVDYKRFIPHTPLLRGGGVNAQRESNPQSPDPARPAC